MAILRVGPEQTRPKGIKRWNGSAWVDITESGGAGTLVHSVPISLSTASVGDYVYICCGA